MKSHVQDGEVVGLQADPSEPAPLEVRVVRPLPVEALTLNRVPCPVSPSLTAWRTARGFAQGCHGCVVSHPVCWGESSPLPSPFNHVSYSCWEQVTSRLSPGCSPWEPSVTASGWQGFGGGGQGVLQALGPASPHNDAPLGSGLGLLRGRGHPKRAAPGSLPSRWGLGLQRLRKSCWSQAETISSGSSLSG